MNQDPAFKLFLDEPIESKDHDVIGFDVYSTVLTQMLTAEEPPYNVALYGNWGNGKSSLARLVQRRLDDLGVPFVTVNAWKYSSQTFPRAFLRAILREVNTNDVSEDVLDQVETKQSTEMKSIGEFLNGQVSWRNPLLAGVVLAIIAGAIARALGASPWIPAVETALVSIAGLYLKELFTLTTTTNTYQRLAYEWLDQFDRLFDKAASQLLARHRKQFRRQKSSPRIVIFVDDLDRLSPSEATSALEAIKTYSQGKPTVFLVACDESKIRKALERELGSADPSTTPTSFLDKLFQFSFRLPPYPGRNLRAYAEKLVENHPEYPLNVSDGLRAHRAKILDFLIHPGVSNPRQVKALLNEFAVMYHVAAQKASTNPNSELQRLLEQPLLLAKLAVIRTDFWELYQDLFLYPDLDVRIVNHSKSIPFSQLDTKSIVKLNERLHEFTDEADRRALYYLMNYSTLEQRQKLVNFLVRTRSASTEDISLALFMDDDPAVQLLGRKTFNELDQAARSGNAELVRDLLRRADGEERTAMIRFLADRLDNVTGLDELQMVDVLIGSHGVFTTEEKSLLADSLSAHLIHLSAADIVGYDPLAVLDYTSLTSSPEERFHVINRLIEGLYPQQIASLKGETPHSIVNALLTHFELLTKVHVERLHSLLYPISPDDRTIKQSDMLLTTRSLITLHRYFSDVDTIQKVFFGDQFFRVLATELVEEGADHPEHNSFVRALQDISPRISPDTFFPMAVELLGAHPANHELALNVLEQRINSLGQWRGFVQNALIDSLKVLDEGLIPRTLDLSAQTGELQPDAAAQLQQFIEMRKEDPETIEQVLESLFPVLPANSYNRIVESVLWPLIWTDKLKGSSEAIRAVADLVFENSELLEQELATNIASQLNGNISRTTQGRTTSSEELFAVAYASESFRVHLEPARATLMTMFRQGNELATTLLSQIVQHFQPEQREEFLSAAANLLQQPNLCSGRRLEDALRGIITLARSGHTLSETCVERMLARLSETTEQITQVVLETLLATWNSRSEQLQVAIKDAVLKLMPSASLAEPLGQLIPHLDSTDWITLANRMGEDLMRDRKHSQVFREWISHQTDLSEFLVKALPENVKDFARECLSTEQATNTVAIWATQVRERENPSNANTDTILNEILELSGKASDLSEVDKVILGYLVGSRAALVSVLPFIDRIYQIHSPPEEHRKEWIQILPELFESITDPETRRHAASITASLGIKPGQAFRLWQSEFERLSSSPAAGDKEQVSELRQILKARVGSDTEVAAGSETNLHDPD